MPATVTRDRTNPYILIRTPGGAGVDDHNVIQAAVDELATGTGGRVILGPGEYLTSQTITFPTGTSTPITIEGAGMRATKLGRTTDTNVIDMSGTANGATVTSGHTLKDLAVSGKTTGTTPVMRLYYASVCRFERVRWTECAGLGIDGVQVWDSYWMACRFERLGSTDGTIPAVRFACRTSDTSGVMGYSTDSNNQLDFDSCVLESGSGGLWFLRNAEGATGSTQNNHTINLRHLHAEQNATAGPYLKFHGSYRCNVSDSFFYTHTLQSGASAVNVIEVGSSAASATGVSFRNTHWFGSANAGTTRTFMRVENASGFTLDNTALNYETTGYGPSVAGVEWVGTNSDVKISGLRWQGNPDNTAMFSGAPTSFSRSNTSMPVFSGAGRTTVADTDFNHAVWDGLLAVVRNTSDGAVHLGVRQAGAWKHVELT